MGEKVNVNMEKIFIKDLRSGKMYECNLNEDSQIEKEPEKSTGDPVKQTDKIDGINICITGSHIDKIDNIDIYFKEEE